LSVMVISHEELKFPELKSGIRTFNNFLGLN
jgi:hypothetical protein